MTMPLPPSQKAARRGHLRVALSAFERSALADFSQSLSQLVSIRVSVRRQRAVEARFVRWQQDLEAQALVCGPVYQVLCDAAPFKVIDRRFQRRHGWSRETVRRALLSWVATAKNTPLYDSDQIPIVTSPTARETTISLIKRQRLYMATGKGEVSHDAQN